MSDVKWYGQRVRGELRDATDASIRKVALDIEARTKLRITDNQQIDTGFMRNSTYTVTRNGVMGGVSSGVFAGRKRESASPAPLGDADAVVGVGAVYAIYQELKKSFLRVAFEQTIGAAGGIVQAEFRSRGF
jgi:hypothetical protein